MLYFPLPLLLDTEICIHPIMSSYPEEESTVVTLNCRPETYEALTEDPATFQRCIDLASAQHGESLVDLASLPSDIEKIKNKLVQLHDLTGTFPPSPESSMTDNFNRLQNKLKRASDDMDLCHDEVQKWILGGGHKNALGRDTMSEIWAGGLDILEDHLCDWRLAIESAGHLKGNALLPDFETLGNCLLADIHRALRKLSLRRILTRFDVERRRTEPSNALTRGPVYELSIHSFVAERDDTGSYTRSSFVVEAPITLTSMLKAGDGETKSLSEVLPSFSCLAPRSMYRDFETQVNEGRPSLESMTAEVCLRAQPRKTWIS
jgi:hypothetical protein